MINLRREETIVSEQLVDYASLSDEAKAEARKNFMVYYSHQFKGDNLEEVSNLADDRDLAMINHLLEENNFQTVDSLVPLCERMVSSSFDRILQRLNMQYNLNGESQINWDRWTQSLHTKLPVED